MCERRSDSTTPPDFVGEPPAELVAEPLAARVPEDGGPFDHTLGYRVTEEGMKALQEYEEHHGKPTLRKVPLAHTVAEALRDEAWRDHQRQRRKEARARGNHLLTICGRTRGAQEVPELRLLGQWLEKAGFPPGRHCEVEATPGTLIIRAVCDWLSSLREREEPPSPALLAQTWHLSGATEGSSPPMEMAGSITVV